MIFFTALDEIYGIHLKKVNILYLYPTWNFSYIRQIPLLLWCVFYLLFDLDLCVLIEEDCWL